MPAAPCGQLEMQEVAITSEDKVSVVHRLYKVHRARSEAAKPNPFRLPIAR